jgi:hypothetical protein
MTETFSLTLGEEHKPRIFENRMLFIFAPKRDVNNRRLETTA